MLTSIISERYEKLFELALDKATMAQLSQAMSEHYGVTGDTREKALRFFLSALEYCGIEVSSYILAAKRTAGRKRKSNGATRRASTTEEEEGEQDEPPPDPKGKRESYKLHLQSGAMIELAVVANFFTLSQFDRNYIFDLVDKLRSYQGHKEEEET